VSCVSYQEPYNRKETARCLHPLTLRLLFASGSDRPQSWLATKQVASLIYAVFRFLNTDQLKIS